ncbi:hypothetical protein BDE02_01G203500 [Populus trichocarpa]|nr:hypothetical protein BDE02_01G203500 [Populus trichocarpa]
MGAAGRQFGAPARSLPTRTARLPLMRLCVHATTIPTSEPRPREQVETPERDRARTAGREGSRRDKQQADAKDLEGQATSGREGSRRDKRQAAGGNDGDNHAGGCLPRLGRRRPGLGSRGVTPRGRGLRGEPTHGRAHGNLMPRPRQRRALLAIPELSGPPQPRRPGLQLASTGSGHRSRTRRISKGQGTGRGGKRRGQSCGGLSAPARKTEARPRQRAHHATSHVSQASDLRAGAAATAAVTSRQADGRAAAASTLARARQMNATPTPRISSPNAPDGLERVPKTVAGIGSSPAGKRVIDAGNTSGHEAPHFSPSVAAALISPAAGLWAPGQRAPGPECGNPGSSPAAASDVGLAPAAPSLSHAGRRPERGGQGPKAAPPRAREQASRGCRLPRPATSGWPLQRLASPTQGARARRQPPRGRESKPAGAVACRGQRRRAGPCAPSLSHAGARARRQPPRGRESKPAGAVACRGQRRRAGPCSA